MCLVLAICEYYSPHIHGRTEMSSVNIENHVMVGEVISTDEFINGAYETSINSYKQKWRVLDPSRVVLYPQHELVTLDIIQSKEMDGGEIIAIKKTFWIRVIQRRFKRIYQERKTRILLRKNPKNIEYRRTNGKWPKYCAAV